MAVIDEGVSVGCERIEIIIGRNGMGKVTVVRSIKLEARGKRAGKYPNPS